MKIIFVNCVPISKLFGNKVDVEWYAKQGYDVEYWDMSKLYWSKAKLELYFSGAVDFKYTAPNHRFFYSKKEVLAELGRLSKSTFIYNLSRQSQACVDDFWLLRAIKKLKLSYAVQQIENQFVDPRPRNAKSKAFSILPYIISRVYPLQNLWNSFLIFAGVINLKFKTLLFDKTNFYALPTLAVGVGRIGRRNFQHLTNRGCEYLSIPSPSIDWVADKGDKDNLICLFVDESIGHEPDSRLHGSGQRSDFSSYYSAMKGVFNMVEEVTGCRVVVGASGKVHYKDNPFEREIVYKKTLTLAAKATMVIGHSSSALHHCLCLKLPVLLIDDANFTVVKKQNIANLAAACRIPVYRADKIQSSDVDSVFKKSVKSKFVDEYFKENGVDIDYKSLILDALIRIEKKLNH